MTKQYTYTKNKDGFMGSENRIEKTELGRIADAMEEILRLVKEDQEQYKKKSKDEEEQSWPTGLGKEENAKEKN